MVYAIATTSAVLIYSTDKMQPLYGMGNFHYAALTDLSWRGSSILGVSSSDGYCSFMMFDNN
jgi:chromatin assembly factor 1 subunit B